MSIPYCTRTDIELDLGRERLIEVTDLADPTMGMVNDSVLNKAILAASGEIDTYTGARYGVPLPTVTELVRDIASALTIDRLFRFSKPEEVQKRADAARRTLRDISNGLASLPGIDSAAPSGAGAVLYRDTSPAVFSREGLKDY